MEEERRNYFAMLGDVAEDNQDGTRQRGSPSNLERSSAGRRSGLGNRLSPNTRVILAERAARSASVRDGSTDRRISERSYRDVLAAAQQSRNADGLNADDIDPAVFNGGGQAADEATQDPRQPGVGFDLNAGSVQDARVAPDAPVGVPADTVPPT